MAANERICRILSSYCCGSKVLVILFIAGLTAVTAASVKFTGKATTQCYSYTSTECDRRSGRGCQVEIETCKDSGNACMALWKNDSDGLSMQDKGCWSNSENCIVGSECITNMPAEGTHFFCCCMSSLCNGNVSYVPFVNQSPPKPKVLTGLSAEATQCYKYDKTRCERTGEDCQEYVQTCPDEKSACMALWKNDSDGFSMENQGCWSNPENCIVGSECIANEPSGGKNHFFCCCISDLCNRNVSYLPFADASPSSAKGFVNTTLAPVSLNYVIALTVIYSLVPITIFTTVVLIVYWVCRRHHYSTLVSIPTTEPSPLTTPLTPTSIDLQPLQLIEVKARGRFGCVWKAQSLNEFVAVKVFPLQDKLSWLREQEMYSIPGMQHDSVLSFIGTEKRGEGIDQELWLITEYHQRGSLYDYLKANLITWSNLCHIAESMAQGLSFLHDPNGIKPSIAHRDFKSKNVLLKNNLTACIADFGLACKFEAGQSLGENHGQVGTRRYMAPEVLEGAIQFSQNAFLRLDMYACGLVLWELASRCSVQDGPVDEYMLPFEEEVGQAPTLEDMQECVVHRRQRPCLRETWLQHQGLASVCDTIEECWDHEAEARLTAGCVEERISQLIHTTNQVNTMDLNTTNSTTRSPLINDLTNSSTIKESSL